MLYCFGNQLTTLDVTQNSQLQELRCDSNQLTTLDVTQNTQLQVLGCYYNQLTTLDVTQNTLFKAFSNKPASAPGSAYLPESAVPLPHRCEMQPHSRSSGWLPAAICRLA